MSAPASASLTTQIDFEMSLKEGDYVEVRWTNSHRYYRAVAKIVRVNDKSMRVVVTAPRTREGSVDAEGVLQPSVEYPGAYLVGRTLAFPRFFANTWSVNNGIFPIV